eukprot:scaffold3451_cov116-Isochrysis_galbana.AAC.1
MHWAGGFVLFLFVQLAEVLGLAVGDVPTPTLTGRDLQAAGRARAAAEARAPPHHFIMVCTGAPALKGPDGPTGAA